MQRPNTYTKAKVFFWNACILCTPRLFDLAFNSTGLRLYVLFVAIVIGVSYVVGKFLLYVEGNISITTTTPIFQLFHFALSYLVVSAFGGVLLVMYLLVGQGAG